MNNDLLNPTAASFAAGSLGPEPMVPDEDLDAAAPLAPSASASTKAAATVIDAMPTADTVQRVAQAAHDTVDRVAERAAPMVEEWRRKADDTSNRLQARRDQLNDWGSQMTSQCRSSVREHPMAAVGLAALVGLIFGRLTAR